jgi:hypothetical protein
LQVLEKEQGIDLYDGNSYGGMWLKTKNNNDDKLKNIFVRSERIQEKNLEKNSEKEQIVYKDKYKQEELKTNENKVPNNLINFFKNGK